MAGFQRSGVTTIVKRLTEEPRRLITVFGPRQTGKTTMVRQALGQIDLTSRYLSVDEPGPLFGGFAVGGTAEQTSLAEAVPTTEWIASQWREARRLAEREPQQFVLVFDEIQKVPDWSEAVKGLWDADRQQRTRLHVVLLGSAPLVIQSGLSESLAGRFESILSRHWSLSEMSEAFDFNLDQYVYFGGYPGAADLIEHEERWRDYILRALIEPHLERDLLAMTRVDKPSLLKRLFELGASYSGQILSYNKMLGQLQDAGNTTTLARYLDLLAAAGLLAGLPKYSGSAHRRRGSSPKLNVLNTALMSATSGYTFQEARADRTFWGRLVESCVGAHLINTAPSNLSVSYWREASLEVDFVIRAGSRVRAVEVKSGHGQVSDNSLREFERRYNAPRSLTVGEGGIPLNEFLAAPTDEWFRLP
ncbi:MAG: ATP-binding protein [Chloroflexota bacterium]|nr:ATP-binding protein [Chloroflexota bacterium]MDE2891783.1 ATP-binding protein [Chloroflexota bacterium]